MGYFRQEQQNGEQTAVFDVEALFTASGREAPVAQICLVVHADSATSCQITFPPTQDRRWRQTRRYLFTGEQGPVPYPVPRLRWASPAGRGGEYNPFYSLAQVFVLPGLVDQSPSLLDSDAPKRRLHKNADVAEMVHSKMSARMASNWWNALWRRALPHIEGTILKESRRFSQDLLYHNLRLRHKAFGQLTVTCPAAALFLLKLFETTQEQPGLCCLTADRQAKLLEDFAGGYLQLPLPMLIDRMARLLVEYPNQYEIRRQLPFVPPSGLPRSNVEFIRRVSPYAAAGWDCQTIWETTRRSLGDLDINRLRQLRGLNQWKGFRAVYFSATLAAAYLRNPEKGLQTLRESRLQGEPCGNRLAKWLVVTHQAEDYLRRPDATPGQDQKLSLENLIRRAEEWHRQFAPARNHGFNNDCFSWDLPFPTPWIQDYTKEDLRLVFLSTGAALQEESQRMQHCVWSYSGRVHQGICQIYSVRDRNDSSIGTVELSPGLQVVQAQGKGNRVLPRNIRDFIKEAVAAGQGVSSNRIRHSQPPLPVVGPPFLAPHVDPRADTDPDLEFAWFGREDDDTDYDDPDPFRIEAREEGKF